MYNGILKVLLVKLLYLVMPLIQCNCINYSVILTKTYYYRFRFRIKFSLNCQQLCLYYGAFECLIKTDEFSKVCNYCLGNTA